jgi:hypothetical protein
MRALSINWGRLRSERGLDFTATPDAEVDACEIAPLTNLKRQDGV